MRSLAGSMTGQVSRDVRVTPESGWDPSQVATFWPVGVVSSVRPTGADMNNGSYAVEASSGRYSLRICQNTADRSRLRYEHQILRQLQETGLSLQVPVPVRSQMGETYAPTTIDGRSALVALQPIERGEAAALPLLWRLYEVVSLVHWTVRCLEGLTDVQKLVGMSGRGDRGGRLADGVGWRTDRASAALCANRPFTYPVR